MQSSLLCVCSYSLRMETDTLSIKKMEGGGGEMEEKKAKAHWLPTKNITPDTCDTVRQRREIPEQL